MGLDDKQITDRANIMKDVKTFSPNEKKPYVFISYKSDNWEIVLNEIVRTMVNKYGLRVYYDANFDKVNNLWCKSMMAAMESASCICVLAFLTKEYMNSYACAMEIINTKAKNIYLAHDRFIDIIPIIIDEEIKSISDLSGNYEPATINEWDSYSKVLDKTLENRERLKGEGYTDFIDYVAEAKEKTQEVTFQDLANCIKNALKGKTQERRFLKGLDNFYDNLKSAIENIPNGKLVFDESLIGTCPSNNNIGITKQMNDVEAKKHLNNEVYNDKSTEPSSEFAEKIGAFVKENIPKLFEQYTFSEEEIAMLLDKEYSRKTFGLGYPFLSKEKIITKVKDKDIPRCYKDPIKINGQDYYLTSQWFASQFEPLKEWIKTTKNKKSSSTI